MPAHKPGRGDTKAAIQTVNGIENRKKAYALADIASTQAQAGDKQGALGTIEGALQAANGIDDDSLRTAALAHIASIQAEAGDMQVAIQTANSIDNDWSKADALSDIATAQEPMPGT